MARLHAVSSLSIAIIFAACARASTTADELDVTPRTGSVTVAGASEQARDSSALARVGFLQRENRTRGGYFLTPEDIAATRAVTTSDLFRQVPLLIEVPGRTGNVLRGANGCLATYVDGVRWRSMFPGDLDAYTPVNDVVAAEVYPPGQLPPPPFDQSGTRFNCTTLGIWTRSAVG